MSRIGTSTPPDFIDYNNIAAATAVGRLPTICDIPENLQSDGPAQDFCHAHFTPQLFRPGRHIQPSATLSGVSAGNLAAVFTMMQTDA